MIESKLKYTTGCFVKFTVVILLLPLFARAQFVDLQLNIEPKLEARTEQPLDFGVLQSNAGRHAVELGSPGMGIFSITALENKLLLVSFNLPGELQNRDIPGGEAIPVQLFARYGYSMADPNNSFLFSGGHSSITVEANSEPGPWSNIYLFIYGSVDVGDVPPGLYSEEIVLNVEYI